MLVCRSRESSNGRTRKLFISHTCVGRNGARGGRYTRANWASLLDRSIKDSIYERTSEQQHEAVSRVLANVNYQQHYQLQFSHSVHLYAFTTTTLLSLASVLIIFLTMIPSRYTLKTCLIAGTIKCDFYDCNTVFCLIKAPQKNDALLGCSGKLSCKFGTIIERRFVIGALEILFGGRPTCCFLGPTLNQSSTGVIVQRTLYLLSIEQLSQYRHRTMPPVIPNYQRAGENNLQFTIGAILELRYIRFLTQRVVFCNSLLVLKFL